MAAHNQLGALGEDLALSFLEKKGYKLIAKNWRFRRNEIDLIMQDADNIVFVEVKTRTKSELGVPTDAITSSKIRHLVSVAHAYLQQHQSRLYPRFDIVAIVINPEGQTSKIEHIEDAFYPPLS